MTRHVNIGEVDRQLQNICDRAVLFESRYASQLAAVDPAFRDSARNFVHYVALRHEDIRQMQEDLTSLGLSSLGRAERNVMPSIHRVRKALRHMAGGTGNGTDEQLMDVSLRKPDAQLHNKAIFGSSCGGRDVSIMVTLPNDASSSYALVLNMIKAGMNIARINCGHDSEPTWVGMIENVRKASDETGQDCKILMDLSGVKLRTSGLCPGPLVVHIKPRRDPLGRVIGPRRLRFVDEDDYLQPRKPSDIPVPRECIQYANAGDRIRIKDARGKKRRFRIVSKNENSLILESHKGAYITSGNKLRLDRKEAGETLCFRVGMLAPIEQPILLRPGDVLHMHGKHIRGAPAITNAAGEVTESAHIGCQQAEVFAFVKAGESILLNDGKISGVIRATSNEQLQIEITQAKPTGSKLRANRGISFPGSTIPFAGLTASDKTNLKFVVNHADAVGLPFAREPADVFRLQEELGKYPDHHLGLVVKIETREGFDNLAELLLAAMRSYPAAIMIARGDLAMASGWERLAEMQEEILWLCEAAHLPVIWATEVLEQEAKKGRPSRAEITDAAMSQRADCVMLNKGPHILATIAMLDNILRRMQDHQYKKTARLRKLSISH